MNQAPSTCTVYIYLSEEGYLYPTDRHFAAVRPGAYTATAANRKINLFRYERNGGGQQSMKTILSKLSNYRDLRRCLDLDLVR